MSLVQGLAVVAVAVVVDSLSVVAVAVIVDSLSVGSHLPRLNPLIAVATVRYRLVAYHLVAVVAHYSGQTVVAAVATVRHRFGADLYQSESVRLASVYSPFAVGRIHEHQHPST